MKGFRTVEGIGVVVTLLLGLCQNCAGAWTGYAKSGIQQILQKSPDPVLPYRNGYTSYQPFGNNPQPMQYQGYVTDPAALPVAAFPAPNSFASRSVLPAPTPVTVAPAPLPVPVSPFRFGYTNYQPFGSYQGYMPVFRPQSLQYQGYSVAAPTPVTSVPAPPCPDCPAPTPAPTCPAPVPGTMCPAPVPAPACLATACPAPVPAPVCPAPIPVPACPAPVPAPACPGPVCPAPVPAPACPATVCPAPVPAPVCPAPIPAPACPAPVPTPACPATVCPAPVPAPACPAPDPAPVCPDCPAPTPAPACPAPVPAPVCPAPDPAPVCPDCPAPTPAPACPAPVPTPPQIAPEPLTCPVDSYVVEAKKRIMDYDNWKCSNMTDANGVVQACVLTGTGPITTSASPGTRCNWIMPLFCDPTLNQVAATMAITPPTPPVPAGYTLVPNQGYFKLHTEKVTYDEAAAICASEGTALAAPLTIPDYDPLVAVFMNSPPIDVNGFYIQYTDQRNSMDYDLATLQRLCTVHVIGWQNIYINLVNENCTVLGFYGYKNMQDIPCTWKQPFMCQQPLPERYKLAPCG